MANNYTSTVSHPGAGWHMLWPSGGLANLQLDVVGFLAILGEDAVRRTSRLASLSPFFLLPRLLPAPHSLLYSERIEQLETLPASLASIHTGNTKGYLPHIAGTIFTAPKSFEVRCLELVRRPGLNEEDGGVYVKWNSPVVIANLFGTALSIAVLVSSICFGDGMSLVATVLLSGLSTFVGITNRWHLNLRRRSRMIDSDGDTVIRWRHYGFLIVKCSTGLAQELFWGPQDLNYTTGRQGFLFFSLLGTLCLMVSVVALANAKIQLQLAWAVAYITLNIVHWIAAALPKKYNWNFSAYEMKEQGVANGPYSKGFTEALWKTILFTQSTEWIKITKAVPRTAAWDEWLVEAEHVSKLHGSHIGPLRNQIWPGESGLNGVIWDGPQHWDPKEAYERICEEERKQTGAMSSV